MPESKVRGPNIRYRPEVIAKMEQIAELKGISKNQAYEEAAMIYLLNFEKAHTKPPPENRENWALKWKNKL